MKFLISLFFTVFLFANEIFVASATGNAYAMPEIIKEYNKIYPNDNVHLIFASSGKLTAQIMHGAKYDIFLAANMKYPLFLYKKGIVLTKPKIYAYGTIVLFSRKPINGNYKDIILNATSIAIANPKTAPYGKAAVEFLKNTGLYDKVKDKLIYAETVSAAFNYSLHSTDIGIIAKSLLFSPNTKKYKNWINLPNGYTPINQGVVLLNKKAENFYNFLFSDEAKKIFKKYGYIVK
ncbi:molybdate transport system substrate-binding protein [Lebetimonas natsushimae]|uniref:Molybdate transport system substrate-binding protein n=1 Tax=Lebetimonas natsushimae TaxID=1936991 RepID=A0A292YEN6_9BACT|nr:molybdate ABC transporter substrate-binding protein [Lebetimonas natsushimae]GAX88287.1 molybdate transport system substrate-binding protein [Lebetimonas natsushimae]